MEKRNVPPFLRRILDVDIKATKQLLKTVDKAFCLSKYKSYFQALEISGHGVPWLILWLAFLWIVWDASLFDMQVNLYVGLILDIIVIWIAKAFVRRHRPEEPKGNMYIMSDQYSFPSGHTSRSVFVAAFFTFLYPVSTPLLVFVWSWAVAVAISRVLQRRHYILDVLGGIALGFLEAFLMGFFWLSRPSCVWLVSFITDERIADDNVE